MHSKLVVTLFYLMFKIVVAELLWICCVGVGLIWTHIRMADVAILVLALLVSWIFYNRFACSQNRFLDLRLQTLLCTLLPWIVLQEVLLSQSINSKIDATDGLGWNRFQSQRWAESSQHSFESPQLRKSVQICCIGRLFHQLSGCLQPEKVMTFQHHIKSSP